MKKLFLILATGLGVTGCATTTQPENEVLTNLVPRVVYVNPHGPWIHDQWIRHHWHWGWHHRHGWGAHHPHFYHVPRHVHPHRPHSDQRRTIPTPGFTGNGSHIPQGENLK